MRCLLKNPALRARLLTTIITLLSMGASRGAVLLTTHDDLLGHVVAGVKTTRDEMIYAKTTSGTYYPGSLTLLLIYTSGERRYTPCSTTYPFSNIQEVSRPYSPGYESFISWIVGNLESCEANNFSIYAEPKPYSFLYEACDTSRRCVSPQIYTRLEAVEEAHRCTADIASHIDFGIIHNSELKATSGYLNLKCNYDSTVKVTVNNGLPVVGQDGVRIKFLNIGAIQITAGINQPVEINAVMELPFLSTGKKALSVPITIEYQ
ncbi:hypothetical protein NMS83_000293 [Vibrio cholerae]|nr:hypothetical protein [Vibrio cholerae]